MPALAAGIDVFISYRDSKAWMAGT